MEKPFVLLAEDNEGTSTLIQAVLKREFEVDVVTEGLEAVERLKRRSYAAILIDLLMPVHDGFTVLEFLRTTQPDLLARVLIVTASVSPREMTRLNEYPVAALIRKPFEIETLLNGVRTIAGTSWMPPRGPFLSSGMLLLLADLLRQRLM